MKASGSFQNDMQLGAPEDEKRGCGRWLEVAALAVILIIALLLRFYKLDVSLWSDEVLTHRGAAVSLWEAIRHRTHFLYYVLAHLSLMGDDNEVMLRLPSVLGGVAGIAALYALARCVAGIRAAFIAALLLTFSTYHVDHSQEARYYALVMLASVLMTWALWRAITSGGWKSWAAFVFATNFGVATHLTVLPYLCVLVAAAAACLLLQCRKDRRQLLRQGSVLALCTLLSFGSIVLSMALRGESPNLSGIVLEDAEDDEGAKPQWRDLRSHEAEFRLSPRDYMRYLREFSPIESPVLRGLLLIPMLLGAAVLLRRAPVLALLIAAQFVLVPLPFFFIDVTHWFNDRYFCSVVPFYSLFAGAGLVTLVEGCGKLVRSLAGEGDSRSRWGRVIECGVIAALAVAVLVCAAQENLNRYRTLPPRDWKKLASDMSKTLQPGDTVAFASLASVRTRARAESERKYKSANAALLFYLQRAIEERRPGQADMIIGTLDLAPAGTTDQIEDVMRKSRHHTIYFVSREEEGLPAEVQQKLYSLPVKQINRYRGLKVRIVAPGA
ncbi:MAG: glycosyltransferase family 39 protein [Candidatus Hydrogenedentes bacterium]|nr:glycosyltransferase family 39 protein [Candidatus Hydrogenedentota bacterium]